MDPTQIELLPPDPLPPEQRRILQPGVHRGVSKALYLSDPCETPSLSNSIAQLVLHCPSYAQHAHPRLGGANRDSTPEMRGGNLFDSLILGGEDDIAVVPEEMPDADGKMKPTKGELRMKSAKAWAEAQEAAGRVVVSADELEAAKEKAEAIKANLLGRWGLEFTGENQLVLVWVDDHGVLCRGRLDHVLCPPASMDDPPRTIETADVLEIIDLKTTSSAHPDEVAAHMHRYGYDVQGHAYVRAVETLFPQLAGRVTMRFAFVETKAPFETLVVGPAASMRELGKWKWERALRIWHDCLTAGHWPGYTAPPGGVEAKNWALEAMTAVSILPGGSQGVAF